MIFYDEQPRGRPRGHKPRSFWLTLSSIAQFAAKYSLDPKLLLDALTEAWAHGQSHFEPFEINCRQVNQDTAVFLILIGEKVVWQFPIEKQILQYPGSFKSEIPVMPAPLCKEASIALKHISDLKYKMRDVRVKGKIIEVPSKILVSTRFGTEAYVSHVLLADETGTIRLSLWNDQINEVAVGDMVSIENAKVGTFCGMPQLKVGKNSIIRVETAARKPE